VKTALAARVWTVETKPVAQDAHGLQPKVVREPADVLLLSLNQIRSGLRMLTADKSLAQRPHAAAHAIPRLDHRRRRTSRFELARGAESGKAGTGDDRADAMQISTSHR
jgi:hypothetical protein